MAGFFYQLGRSMAPKVRKGKWVWQSLFGTERDMIAAERTVGRDLAQEVLTQLTAADREQQSRVAEIGSRLCARLRGPRRDFDYTVVEEGPANAFALPGGYVFVTRSMSELCREEEAQMAFVLAHEMAHILKGHTMERIVLDSAVSVASNMRVARGAVGAWARRVGIGAIQNAHSQERELVADAFATRLSRAAGFDASRAEALLTACSPSLGQEETEAAQDYFSSHPPAKNRIAAIRRVLRGD